jgi:type II secretory pathway component PulJ
MRWRLLREEEGFTLAEMMVTMLVMITVMFALYSIFDMSVRVYGVGNDKVEAAENARIGMDKIARELRAAYPANKAGGKTQLFWSPGSCLTGVMPTGTQVTFGNDFNGNRMICNATTGLMDSGEEITYSLSGSTLLRNGKPVVEFVNGLTFTYMDAKGNTVASNEGTIARVHVKLDVAVDRSIHEQPVTQTLETDVALRNRKP